MKPFLGTDLTADKNNEQVNGIVFLAQTPSAALLNSLEDSSKKVETTLENAKLPKALRVVQAICCFAGMVLGIGILKADASLKECAENAPGLVWAAAICIAIWLVLLLLGKMKEKKVLGKDENVQTLSHLDGVAGAIYNELSVPEDAKSVDVLCFYYKTKNEEIKVQEKGMQIAQYLNPVFKIFTDRENLYLANLEGKYAFPFSSITKIHTVKKHIRIAGWNKDESYNQGIYKQYKLTTDNYGCIHCKRYHILEINHQGETYGIYVPCYDLPLLEGFTGLKAPTE